MRFYTPTENLYYLQGCGYYLKTHRYFKVSLERNNFNLTPKPMKECKLAT
jgi:hypothetical protein